MKTTHIKTFTKNHHGELVGEFCPKCGKQTMTEIKVSSNGHTEEEIAEYCKKCNWRIEFERE